MRVCLINMPFAYLRIPSIGITQLKSVLDDQLGSEVTTELHYLNIDIAGFLDFDIYNFIAENSYSQFCNFGEWYFRQEAFPFLNDNSSEYFRHYGLEMERMLLGANQTTQERNRPVPSNELIFYSNVLLDKRKELGDFLDSLIVKNRLHEADIVGFTSLFQQNLPCFALARRIRQMNPHVTIIMGGSNCESPMGEEIVRMVDSIDYVFSGTALISLPEFVKAYLDGIPEKCESIDGVFSKRNLGSIRYRTKNSSLGITNSSDGISPYGKELSIDQPIELDYEEFIETLDNKAGENGIKPILLFETSRGCWWGVKSHCSFCGLNTVSMNYRPMKADNAVNFLNAFFARYGDKVKQYSSVDNIMPHNYVKEVFPRVSIPNDCSIFYEVKSNLNKEQLESMAKARILTIQPGIESLHSDTLKLMRKGVTAAQNIQLLKDAKRVGIKAIWNLLIGFPGETEKSILNYDFEGETLFHLDPPKGVSLVRFDRYSPYFDNPTLFGLTLKPQEHYFFTYPDFTDKRTHQIAYFFEDENKDSTYRVHAEKWYGKLERLVDSWAKRHLSDVLIPPVLEFKTEKTVLDTRSGKTVLHAITETQNTLLKKLSKPLTWNLLTQDMDEPTQKLLSKNLELLIVKGLIFHEARENFVSLVSEGN